MYTMQKKSTKLKYGINGILNNNNTCFISSALQCVLRIMPLKDYFDNKIHKDDMKNKKISKYEKEFLY